MNPTSNIVEHMPTLEAYAKGCSVLIELGSEYGTGSTAAFARGIAQNPKAKLWVTVDIRDQIKPDCRPTFLDWHFVKGDSRSEDTWYVTWSLMRTWVPNTLADLIFIDTDHTYEQMKRELKVWSPLVHTKGTWLFHDTWMNGKYNVMTEAIKEFANSAEGKFWEYVDLSKENNGLGALVPKGERA